MADHNNLISWDAVGEHFYETGVDHGVLYLYDNTTKKYTNGVAWNGLTAVNERPSGAESTALYADNIKYLNLVSAEDFAATIEAYTYPDEFMQCDGTATLEENAGIYVAQQTRAIFGFSYRTLIGNDTEGTKKGYKLHLVYGCQAAVSERSYSTVNDSPEAITFSWEVSTTPAPITSTTLKPTAHIVIDSTKCDPDVLAAIEAVLYGTAAVAAVEADAQNGIEAVEAADAVPAKLPLPDEILEIIDGLGD